VIRRLLTGSALALALLAPAASAQAATRAVQAFDTPTFRTIWWPKSIAAQKGDTVEWRLTQPGNVNASTHDIWLQAPGSTTPQFLGASYETPKATAVVGSVGTYQFYCSIHGGLTPGGMNGTVVVTETDPGPPVDPGAPWTDPDWEDPEYPGDGPLPLPNDSEAPTVFEEGDNDAPVLRVLKVAPNEQLDRVRVRWRVSEPGFVTVRLKLRKKVVATKIVDVEAGRAATTLKLPLRFQDRGRRYKLEVWATDRVEIDSSVHRFNVQLGHS
jgi:plastocyanin